MLPDPAIGREAARRLDIDRAEVGEDHLPGARDRILRAVGPEVALLCGLAPDAMNVVDQLVELVLGLVVASVPDQPQVDRGVPPVGDDGKQDVVALLHLALARLDRLDPSRQVLLIILEGRARLGRDKLALAATDARQRQQPAQVGLLHHVSYRAEHHHQVGDVDERGKAGHRLVGTARLQLQLRAGVAESRRPGVELMHAPLPQRLRRLEPQQRIHLAQGVGDRRSR